nr:hypothetical protein [Pirellulaceae bacterium]
DVQTALACEMQLTEFQGFPAFQWVVRVRNDGATDSAKLHDFWGIDTAWNAAEGSMPILHRSVGSPGHEGDFHLMSEVMHNSMWDQRRRIPMDTPTNARWGQTHAYHLPADKRSSAHWLPFFNYQTGGDGLISGLGWSGAWRAYFDHPGEGKSTILAGVENLDTILYFLTGTPDGKIRDGQTLLLDLGKPEAFQWAVDVVAGLIDSYDIDWYEEDFNLEARDACEIVIMEKPRLGRTCPAHFPKTRRPVSCTSCSRSRCGSHVQYIHTGAAL